MNGQDDIIIERIDEVSLARLPASVAFFNPEVANQIVDRLSKELAVPSIKVLIADMEDIDHCGSQLITMLVHLHVRAQRHKKELRVCEVKPFVHGVLKTTGLDVIFRIFEKRDEALQA